MPRYTDAKFAAIEERREERVEHLFRLHSNPARKRKKHYPLVQFAVKAIGTVESRDSRPIYSSILLPCCERGCMFPAAFEIFDIWGSQKYCRQHHDQIQRGRSLEDRVNPLVFEEESRTGRRRLSGIHIRRAPLPLFFGLRVAYQKLEIAGRALAVDKVLISAAARKAGMATPTVRAFAAAAGIEVPRPYQDWRSRSKYRWIDEGLANGQTVITADVSDPRKSRALVSAALQARRFNGKYYKWAVLIDGPSRIKVVQLESR